LRQSTVCDWQFDLCLATIRGRCCLSETAQSIHPLGEDEVTATNITALRELASRSANGVEVRLLWAGPEGCCSVAVTDITTGEAFQIEVRAGERALDVFHHPYAYAAWHGVGLASRRESSDRAVWVEREALAA
jgi:hypothetical protein